MKSHSPLKNIVCVYFFFSIVVCHNEFIPPSGQFVPSLFCLCFNTTVKRPLLMNFILVPELQRSQKQYS